MEIFNLHGDEWNETTEHEGFAFKDGWVGAKLGAELIGGSLYEVAPGKKLWPYHVHHANEEWAIVIRGRPTLRTPEGERELVEGDVACFLRGPAGAHQIVNRTEEPVRVLMLSTRILPELIEGDVACFLRGPAGAHQIVNRTEEPVRVLMLSTRISPELIEYVDSGKIAATDANGKRLFRAHRGEPAEYWDGE